MSLHPMVTQVLFCEEEVIPPLLSADKFKVMYGVGLKQVSSTCGMTRPGR